MKCQVRRGQETIDLIFCVDSSDDPGRPEPLIILRNVIMRRKEDGAVNQQDR